MTKAIFFGFYAILVLLMFRRPAVAAGCLLCTWALDQWARSQDAWFFANHGITNWMSSLFVVAALGVRALKGKPVFKPLTREYFLTVGMFALAILSVIWSTRRDDTVNQLWLMWKTIVVFAFLMPLSVSDLKDLSATLFTVLVVGFTITLLVMTTGEWHGRTLMFKTGMVLAEEGLERGNPLAIANLAAYVALAAMLMNFRGKARLFQMLRYGIIGLAFATSVRSGSRGQTVSIIFCTLCFLPYSRRFKDLKSFATLAISTALFAFVTLYLLQILTADRTAEGVGERWDWQEFVGSYQGGRVNTAARLIHAWIDGGPFRWLVGLGSSASFDPDICGFYPHVVFAEVLGELGFIGWVLLWLFPIFSYQNLREIWPSVKNDPESRGLIATLGGLILFEIMMSFKQGSLLGSSVAFAFITMLGRITSTLRQVSFEYESLNAGMYRMTEEDWSDVGQPYDELPVPAGVFAHQQG